MFQAGRAEKVDEKMGAVLVHDTRSNDSRFNDARFMYKLCNQGSKNISMICKIPGCLSEENKFDQKSCNF